MSRYFQALLAALALAGMPHEARAWGSTGHRIINDVTMRTLPTTMPSFLLLPEVREIVVDLGPEMDRVKGAGMSFDDDGNPGHFIRIGDDHRIAGIIALDALPLDMEAYAAKLQTVGTNPYKACFLPYTIADGWERLREDFAYRRVYDYLASHTTGAHRDTFVLERNLLDKIIIADIGTWGHFVGDASQPLHTSVHFNDGGINIPFETDFVRAHVTPEAVQALVTQSPPPAATALVTQPELMAQIGAYLTATNAHVGQLYTIANAGGFRNATPEAVAFTTARVADGARELRNLVVEAYENSLYAKVGTPATSVQDVLNGRAVPTEAMLRAD